MPQDGNEKVEMTREEFRAYVREAVEQADTLDENRVREIVKDTTHETLVHVGVQADDPIEVQKDFQFIRDWRKSSQSVKSKAVVASIGFFVSAALGAAWMGLRSWIFSK